LKNATTGSEPVLCLGPIVLEISWSVFPTIAWVIRRFSTEVVGVETQPRVQ
jgi:hypothetical protein